MFRWCIAGEGICMLGVKLPLSGIIASDAA
jgi:hypothetical protein